MKTEWWYESALYDLDNDLVFARLQVRDDGTAQIFTHNGEKLEFESEDEAGLWLSSDEYYPIDHLIEEMAEAGQTFPAVLVPPDLAEEALVDRMVVAFTVNPASFRPPEAGLPAPFAAPTTDPSAAARP